MYEKFKIEYSLARNMSFRSNMQYCLANVSSEGVNEFIQKVHDRGLTCQKFVSRSILAHIWLKEHQNELMSMY